MNFTQKALMAFSLAFVCISLSASSQTSTPANPFSFRTDLIPPSPNAAALGKYGIVPVSLQTGIPNISIPITEALGQQLKVPITLNYHNNGFKPSEEASWVGLGWSLDAGGVITRIVHDKVDETVVDTGKYENTNWRYTTVDSITNNFMDEAAFFGTIDTEPDVYAFNFGGYSGKFLIYKGKVYQYPFQQLTIGGDPVNGFTIVTPNGDVYTFNLPETTLALTNHLVNPDNPYYNLPSTYTSSWYLQSIRSANYKDQVNFTYAPAESITQNGPAVQNMTVQHLPAVVYTVAPMFFPFPITVQSLRLATISTSKMLIKFNASTTARQDVSGSYPLDNIEVYNYQGLLLNRFVFQTSYFGTSGGGTNNLRLKLTGLLEQGNGSQPPKKHSFQYNETTGWPGKKLPQVDHWGYYNGGADIQTTAYLLPKRDYNGYSVYPPGINKDPDFQNAQLTVLKKVIYPTGGSSVFTFEPNLIYNGLNYVTIPKQAIVEAIRADTTTTNVISSYGSFTLASSQLVHIITTRNPRDGATSGANKDNTSVLQITGPQNFSVIIRNNSDNGGKLDSVQLTAGTYAVQVQCSSACYDATATINYVLVTNQVIEGKAGPGIRIKSIADYADSLSTGTPLSLKQYSYKDSTGVSTGVLLNIPSYGAKDYKEVTYSIPLVTKTFVSYTSANGNGLNASQEMYYKTVYEQQMNGTDYLLSKSEFNLFSPFVENGTNVFLVRKIDFKGSVSTSFTKVQKQEFVYAQVQDSDFFAIKPYLIGKNMPGPSGTLAEGVPANTPLRVYSYDSYDITPTWLRLNSEAQTNYYNTSDSVVTTKSYVYDSPARNTILTTTTDSKGLTHVEKNKYRENYGISVFTPGINSVVERQEWLKRSATDSVLTSGLITQYHTSLYKPLTLYGFESVTPVSSLNQETKNANGLYTSLLSDSRYQGRLFNTYETGFGNLVAEDQVTSTDTTHQVNILWGYHNNYPIAQVKNAKISSVAYTSFEDDDNSWTYTSTNVNSTDSRTGTKCYSGTISKSGLKADNYYLTLWAKGSGTITVGGVAKTITGTWAPYQWQLNNITSVTVNSGSILMDEVRLCPINAEMTTYTYSPQIGVTSSADAKGQITFFEYDSFQRLMNIKDKDGNIIKSYTYHYQGQ